MPNPWPNNYPGNAPFALATDMPLINANNAWYPAPKDWYLETNLFAEPFVGTPDAPIYILNHNPGLGENHNTEILNDQTFRQIITQNLNHEGWNGYPFYIIHPDLKNMHPLGFKWWKRCLNYLIGKYNEQFIARNIFNLELGPYHSRGFRFIPFPSLQYNQELLREAMAKEKIILTIRKSGWELLVPEIINYDRILHPKNHQRASITPGNYDGFQIVTELLDRLFQQQR